MAANEVKDEVKRAETKKCPNCPKCGSTNTSCYYKGETGDVECIFDYYVFWCWACGYVEGDEIYGGGLQEDWGTSCPYCGVRGFSHPKY